MAGQRSQLTTREAFRNLNWTRTDILEVVTDHFARNGLHEARVDEIANETATTKWMVYYCLGSKAGLFSACLCAECARIRVYEQGLNLGALDPVTAMDTYVRATIWYHRTHPQLVRLVCTENLLDSGHLAGSERTLSRPIIGTLSAVFTHERAEGTFRGGISRAELHIIVTALGNYRAINQKTVRALFDFDMCVSERLEYNLDHYCSMILNWLRA